VSAVCRLHSTPAAAAALALALAAAACRDSTNPGADGGPRPTVDVTVAVSQMHGPSLSTDPDGTVRIQCTVNLQAVATGSGSASWEDATFRWYAGKDRSVALDSEVVAASKVHSSWGRPEIGAGQTQRSGGWSLSAVVPFALRIEYRYRAPGAGAPKTTRVDFDCEPAVSASTPPPVVTALAVQPAAGEIDAGGEIAVTYAAESEAGLRQTAVVVTGPCGVQRLFNEALQRTVTRTVHITLPAECRLGMPISVGALALDTALQDAARGVTTSVVLADRTPPVLTPLFFPPAGGLGTETFSGQYFVGDSIQLIPNAYDNHQLHALIWEVLPSGQRDSVLVNTQVLRSMLFIRVRPEWVGPLQLRLYARDAAGRTSPVFTSAPGAARVYPTVERPSGVVTVPGEVRDAVIDARRGMVYLLQSNQSSITALRLATMQVAWALSLPAVPTGFDLTPGGDSLIAALVGTKNLGVIDLRSTTPRLTTINLPLLNAAVDQRPYQLRVAANGKAFVTLEGSAPSAYVLLEVDLRSGAQRIRTDAGNGGSIEGPIERSLDHSRIVINGGRELFQSYDAATDRFGPRRTAAVLGWRPSVDRTGQHVAIGVNVYDETLLWLRRMESPISGIGISESVITADGDYVYHRYFWGLVRSRVSDGEMLDRTPITVDPSLLRTAPDGTFLVAVESPHSLTSRVARIGLR